MRLHASNDSISITRHSGIKLLLLFSFNSSCAPLIVGKSHWVFQISCVNDSSPHVSGMQWRDAPDSGSCEFICSLTHGLIGLSIWGWHPCKIPGISGFYYFHAKVFIIFMLAWNINHLYLKICRRCKYYFIIFYHDNLFAVIITRFISHY